MRKQFIPVVVGLSLFFVTGPLISGVEIKERTQVQFPGMMGKMMGMFGGKSAKEGIVSTVTVVGDRKMTTSEQTAEIIDLEKEVVYQLDLKKKTYKAVTFEEMRRQFQEASDKLAKAESDSAGRGSASDPDKAGEQQVEIDFDLSETGQKKKIGGFDAREVKMVITVRQKGKSLDEAGGMVMTSHLWLSDEAKAAKEVAEFDLRYAQKLYGSALTPDSAAQLAAVAAMYPGMQDAMEKFRSERINMEGTPVQTITVMESVQSKQQIAAATEQEKEEAPTSIGGLFGGFAKKLGKKDKEEPQVPGRSQVMTMNSEILSISTAAAPIEIPAGFKQKN